MSDLPAALPPSPPAPRRAHWWIWGGVAVLLGLLAGIGGSAWLTLGRPVQLSTPHTFMVPRQATLSEVAARLERERLIPNALALRLYARATRQATLLKTGEYEVTDGMTPVDILALLVSGRVKAYWFTVPEGKWMSEIPPLLAPRWPIAAADFTAATAPAPWHTQVPFPLPADSLEGYLFPDSYLLPLGASARQVVSTMLQAFTNRAWKAYTQSPPTDGRSLHEVVTLASLVEAEAKVPTERPIIAGVYLNRLHKHMRLECDATVLFAHRRRLTRVLYRDLELNSPYNTYLYPGLPPGPICNPGQAAFTAALHPTPSPYLYYVARGDGSHVFSRTFAEHQAAIRRIRRIP
jgi:UPF0755 protein